MSDSCNSPGEWVSGCFLSGWGKGETRRWGEEARQGCVFRTEETDHRVLGKECSCLPLFRNNSKNMRNNWRTGSCHLLSLLGLQMCPLNFVTSLLTSCPFCEPPCTLPPRSLTSTWPCLQLVTLSIFSCVGFQFFIVQLARICRPECAFGVLCVRPSVWGVCSCFVHAPLSLRESGFWAFPFQLKLGRDCRQAICSVAHPRRRTLRRDTRQMTVTHTQKDIGHLPTKALSTFKVNAESYA